MIVSLPRATLAGEPQIPVNSSEPACRQVVLSLAARQPSALREQRRSATVRHDGRSQRLFRRLGLHPGADIDAYAAALDGAGLAGAPWLGGAL
jgi:hypothetical protein